MCKSAAMTTRPEYIVAWTTGHTPPRVLYFRATDQGWNGTEDRAMATRFRSARQAKETYDSKHVFPRSTQHCWGSGVWRVEPYQAPMLPFPTK